MPKINLTTGKITTTKIDLAALLNTEDDVSTHTDCMSPNSMSPNSMGTNSMGTTNRSGYISKYQKEKYDDIKLRVPKGKREVYRQEAAKRGMSLNKMFEAALDEYLGGT